MSTWLDEQQLSLLLLFPAGFIAGVINVLAGGGSFLTLPALIAAGLPVHVANGTNRVAVVLQAIVATLVYRKEEQFDLGLYRKLLPPLLLGSLAGASLATVIDPERLRDVFGVLFVLMGSFLLLRELSRRTSAAPRPRRHFPRAVTLPALFLVGIYGGFLQAGVGLWFLLFATGLLGVDAVRANTVKLPLVMTFTLPALFIFLWADQVRILPGIVLGMGNVLGAFVGVKLSLSGGAKLIFRAVMVVLLGTGLSLLLGEGAAAASARFTRVTGSASPLQSGSAGESC